MSMENHIERLINHVEKTIEIKGFCCKVEFIV